MTFFDAEPEFSGAPLVETRERSARRRTPPRPPKFANVPASLLRLQQSDGASPERESPEAIVRRTRAAQGRSAADIETAARMLTLVATVVRENRVTSVRHALAHDDYESALKIEIAVDRLLDELNGEGQGGVRAA